MNIIEKAVDKLLVDGGDPARTRRDTEALRLAPGEDRLAAEQRTRPIGSEATEVAPASVAELAPLAAGAVDGPGSPAATSPVPPAAESPVAPAGEKAEPAAPDGLRILDLKLEGIISPGSERSRIAEEYRMIKRPILQRAFSQTNGAGEHQNLVMVTSSIEGEGKTFTSLNLAISMAMELDRTVLLVDADLAKPGLSRQLRVQNLPGLTERLLDESLDLKGLLLRTDVPKLSILPAGHRHRRSTELLASNTMRKLLDELAVRYPDRIVLFDSPPLLATTEASVLAQQMGQICLVVESARTPQFLVKEAVGLLQDKDRVSLVLNKVKRDFLTGYGKYYYGYRSGYGYGYGQEDARS
jgi:exopolysaccharide/PEP-CTERM locus tyrosine autokinase